MKICVIGTRGFPEIQGGVEKHCESLYPLLPSEDKVIVFRRKGYVHSVQQYPNIRFIDLPSTKIKGLEAVLHSFIATIYTIFIHPDIVHIHNIGPALFSPLLTLAGIKVILTYHSPNYEHNKWGFFAKHILLLSEKIALSRSSSIIFVNKFQMNKYNDCIKKKSYYIPNGIQINTPTKKNDYICSLGLSPQKYILSVGRITPEKGFDCLIKAYNLINTDCKLVIVGSIEAESSYGNYLKKLVGTKVVVFPGYVFGERLNQLYSNAALYVLASYNEGFPLVLLEALSYKLNVIVSDIPATHLVNLQKDDYFEKGNVKMLASKLKERLKNPQLKSYQLSEFNWQQIANNVHRIYVQTCKKKSCIVHIGD